MSILEPFEKNVSENLNFVEILPFLKKFIFEIGSSRFRRSAELPGMVSTLKGARKPIFEVPWEFQKTGFGLKRSFFGTNFDPKKSKNRVWPFFDVWFLRKKVKVKLK